MAPAPKPHNSVTDAPRVFPDLYTLVEESDSSAGYEFHRLGLMYYPNMKASGREWFTQERWCLQCRRGTLHRDPGGCPLSSLLRVTHPRMSSHDAHLLQLSSGAQTEWLCMLFCTLALYEGTSISSILLFLPGAPIPTDFHSHISYVGVSSHLWCSRLVCQAWGWDPMIVKENLCIWDIAPEFQPPPMGAESALFTALTFLPASMWLLL